MRIIYTKTFTLFFFFLAVTAVLMFTHARGWSSALESYVAQAPRPFINLFRSIGRSAVSVSNYFATVSEINKSDALLKEQIRSLQEQNLALQQHKLENEILKKELNYRNTSRLPVVSASAIARDPTGFSQILTIDAGYRDNVKVGDAVVSQGALVGRIASADALTSKVLLITDPQSAIEARNSVTGDNGILRGSYGSGLILDMLSQNAKITKGDLVMTFGLASQIPRGVLIGTIGEIQSKPNDLLQKATVVPAADLKNLIFLDVISSK